MRKAICLIAAAIVLSGCSSAEDSAKSSAPLTMSREAPAAQGGSVLSAAADTTEPDAPSVKESAPAQVTPADQRAVIYTASLRVRARKVDDAAAQAKQFVLAAEGYVANENSSTDPVTASLVLKIPSERYATVLDQLVKQLGDKLGLEQKAEDVTEQVADVDSRVKSAQSALGRLRTLLSKADTVGEVLNVSGEIDRRQADLESLQARQKSLAQRTTFATVSLSLVGPKAAAEPEKKPAGGFLGGLENGWNAFTSFLSGLAAVAGWLLPFAGLALLLGLPYLALRRRRRATRPAPEPELEEV
ncbi:MAG: DUF4349 domain-containing protein [Streptosporangiaceae bacterium]